MSLKWPDLTGGPDAARYIAAAKHQPVPRPFHLRWLLPRLCGTSAARWWITWGVSWLVAAVGYIGWQWGQGWQVALIGCVLLLGLPGILGPSGVIPVGVDLPALALTLCGCWLWQWWPAGLVLIVLAATVKETSPVFAALWLWSPLPLLALLVVVARAAVTDTGPDPLGWEFDRIAAHPVATSLQHHRGQWRDGWVMLAPWGVCLLALRAPSWRVVVALVVAYGLLLVATDTVRLYQYAAGPVMAAAAAPLIPPAWAVLILAAHVMWWRTPSRV